MTDANPFGFGARGRRPLLLELDAEPGSGCARLPDGPATKRKRQDAQSQRPGHGRSGSETESHAL